MCVSDKAICDKYYLVQYCHDHYIEDIKGYLWNYSSGNIILVTNEGVYHIKREEILFMRPIKPFNIEGIEEEGKEQTKTLRDILEERGLLEQFDKITRGE